jgi:hypothetical protein
MKVSNFRSVSKLGGSPLAADKRRLTPIENNELGFVLSAFITCIKVE